MTAEELQALFTKHDKEHGQFARITTINRLHPSRRLCGYLKIASMLKDPKDFDVSAEHDVVYLADAADICERATEADVIYLLRCGVFYNIDVDSLAHFC